MEKWLAAAKKVQADLDERIGRVSALLSIARTGRTVNLKRELEPLAVSRVGFRFQRGGARSSDAAEGRWPRTTGEAAAPSGEGQVPHGVTATATRTPPL